MTDVNLIRYEEVDASVRAYTNHAFLHAANVQIYASRFHFDLAHTVLRQAGLRYRESIAVLEAVLLLHRGLSIHEDVDHTNELQRQLRVLAGDYCSSQYYCILSQTGNQQLLRNLSDAVVRINEAKMTLHAKRRELGAGIYMDLQETIHGELLATLVKTYLSDDESWRVSLHYATRAYVVHLELGEPNWMAPFSLVSAREWLDGATDRLFQGPLASRFQPIRGFVLETRENLQVLLEQQALAEGNH